MLNKKAIAAFAAGATLLSGLAFAAPAFVSAPAFAQSETSKPKSYDDQLKEAQKAKDDAYKVLEEKNKALEDAKAKELPAMPSILASATALTADAAKNYTFTVATASAAAKVTAKSGNDAPKTDESVAANAYLTASFNKDKAVSEATTAKNGAQSKFDAAAGKVAELENELNTAKKNLADAKKAVEDAKAAVDKAFPPYAKAFRAEAKTAKKLKAANYELSTLNANTPEDQKKTDAYLSKLHDVNVKIDAAQAAEDDADRALDAAKAEFESACADYGTYKDGSFTGKLLDYFNAYEAAKAVKKDLVKGYAAAAALMLRGDYDPKFASLPGEGGQGGQGESGKGDKGHGDKPGKPGALPNAAQASANLMHAQVVLQDASANRTKAVKDSNDAKAALDKAQAQYDTLFAQFKAASDNYQNNFVLTGKADTDAGKAAKADVDAAKALVDAYGSNELANAKKDYAEKSGKALVASQAFNAAKEQYRLAYNVALRVEASAVKGFQDPKTIADAPLDFPAATAAAKAEAGKLAAAAAQAGKAADAAAAGAHGAKAAAGENGGKKKNNAGEDAKKKLGQTGATVALAAVAASVLAGVGAALRKIRH